MPRRVRFLTWRTRAARKRIGIEKGKRRDARAAEQAKRGAR